MYRVRKINFGWYKRRHGILLENLPPLKQRLLLENHFMKWLDSDTLTFTFEKKNDEWIDNWFKTNKSISNSLRKDYYEYREKYAGVKLN